MLFRSNLRKSGDSIEDKQRHLIIILISSVRVFLIHIARVFEQEKTNKTVQFFNYHMNLDLLKSQCTFCQTLINISSILKDYLT